MDTQSTARWIEIWVYPDAGNDHLLVLRSLPDGRCEAVDPQRDWTRVQDFESYEAAYYWMRQETYELVEGRRASR